MRAERAVNYYSGKEGRRLNCSQAVAEAFKDQFPLSSETMNELAGCGAGRAPGGVCGALYAVEKMLAATNPLSTAQCRQKFVERGGSDKCHDIRASRRLSCPGCVRTAGEFLEGLK